MVAGRSLWASLHLLDRQLLDRDGKPIGKVDDLVLSWPDDPGRLPEVTELLCGPAALGRRFGRRVGAFFESLSELGEGDASSPASVPADAISEIGSAITIDRSRDDLPVAAVERFLGDHVIGHIPGAGRRPDEGDDA